MTNRQPGTPAIISTLADRITRGPIPRRHIAAVEGGSGRGPRVMTRRDRALRGATLVAMMQPADLCACDDRSEARRHHGPRVRRIVLQREMSARAMVVRDVGGENAP